ncbi:MAG: histidinol dehydrogenase, partial [Bacteroidota bacterium]
QRSTELVMETMPGVLCKRRSVPIQKVGLYVPGGSAPLFSTVLMLGIPAKIAGCEEVIMASPTDAKGQVNPAVLYTANLLGISKILKLGGAQAIAAMAYGTESVPKVDKIFGPGNQYVTVAKQLVSRDTVAIDMPAGPSEVAVMVDKHANPAFAAADLLSQAEHGYDSQVVLVSSSKKMATQVIEEVNTQLQALPRKEIARVALENSIAIVVENKTEAVALLNEYAAEHLILQVNNADEIADQIINAGSIFIGPYSPESVGDYASGTNHTLPTSGWARSTAGVSLDSFVKKITYQKLTAEGLQNIGGIVETMASHEQLEAHKNAVTIRLKAIQSGDV